jgi:hypothetical protein
VLTPPLAQGFGRLANCRSGQLRVRTTSERELVPNTSQLRAHASSERRSSGALLTSKRFQRGWMTTRKLLITLTHAERAQPNPTLRRLYSENAKLAAREPATPAASAKSSAITRRRAKRALIAITLTSVAISCHRNGTTLASLPRTSPQTVE